MRYLVKGSAALLISAAPLAAGGIERAPQSLAALFEEGNYAELSFGGADPTVKGTDALGFSTGDVAQGYGFVGLAYKHQFNENLSGAIIIEQPFGADIRYPSQDGIPDPAATGSPVLGDTSATVDSTTFTALLRYKFENQFSVHGGIRGSKASGEVNLNGGGYSVSSGYNVTLDDSWGMGYVVGIAYEIPDIAGRISLTYNSKVDHDFDIRETGPLVVVPDIGPAPVFDGESRLTVETPKSVNLEFQTGIAEDTLLFGSIRWVDWSSFRVDPERFTAVTGLGLVELEDTTTYTLGIGRKFTENWSGSAALVYEPSGDDLVSPLAPTNGRKGITLAAIYTLDNMKITTGVNYSKLGNARPQTGGDPRAEMRDSEVWGIGIRVGYSF